METSIHRPKALVPPIQTEFVLQHPTPGSDAFQGTKLSNIERLEQTAERISISSADLSEEIRKIWQEQKRRDSRASMSSHRSSRIPPTIKPTRQQSTSSHTHSIVDVNSVARWGGYSPNDYITSPISPISVQSCSSDFRSRAPRSSIRGGSPTSGSGRFVSHERDGCLLDQVSMSSSPTSPKLGNNSWHQTTPTPPTRPDGGASSKDHVDEQIAVEQQFTESPTRSKLFTKPMSLDGVNDIKSHVEDADAGNYDNTVDRDTREKTPDSILKRDDKPGMSSDSLVGEDILRLSPRVGVSVEITGTSTQRQSQSSNVSPPEPLVYYPAPVPRTLNLPQRLSQQGLPSSSPRYSQFVGSLPPEIRKSAIWDQNIKSNNDEQETTPNSQNREHTKQRQSYLSLQGLPPQLRASVFFNQPSITHKVEVKDGSAVATLDSFLDASAQAPVETLAARVAAMGNGPVPRNQTGRFSLLPDPLASPRHTRASLQTTKQQSYDQLKRLSGSILGTGSTDAKSKTTSKTSELHGLPRPDATGVMEDIWNTVEDEQAPARAEARIDNEDDSDDGSVHIDTAPTTLLAELEIRKEHQRLRTRTAATAFPHGMHASLLDLDSVYQMEQKLRQRNRTALAWEHSAGEGGGANDDEDVPLGLLVNARNQDQVGRDPYRPLGLLEKQDLEEREPLAARRYRLQDQIPASLPDAGPADLQDETLAQRTLRLRESKNLVNLPRQSPPQPIQSIVKDTGNPAETLAQRRKRLQASQGAPTPPLHSQRLAPETNSYSYNYLNTSNPVQRHPLPTPPQPPPIHHPSLLSQGLRNHFHPTNVHHNVNIPVSINGMAAMPDFRNMVMGGEVEVAGRPAKGGFMGGLYNDGAGGMGGHGRW